LPTQNLGKQTAQDLTRKKCHLVLMLKTPPLLTLALLSLPLFAFGLPASGCGGGGSKTLYEDDCTQILVHLAKVDAPGVDAYEMTFEVRVLETPGSEIECPKVTNVSVHAYFDANDNGKPDQGEKEVMNKEIDYAGNHQSHVNLESKEISTSDMSDSTLRWNYVITFEGGKTVADKGSLD